MTDNLKPINCGCGGEAMIKKHTFYRALPLYQVRCLECGIATLTQNTKDEAIEAWNKVMSSVRDINVPNKFATDTNVGDKERTAKVSNQIFNNLNPYTVGAWIGTCECGELVSYLSKYCHMCGAKLAWGWNE